MLKPELVAIEIKAGEIKERDLSSIKKFAEKYKPKKAIVISYDKEETIGKIKVIPFYKYFLGGGNG